MKDLVAILKQAYREEKGAEGLEKLLIVAAIVLPLLAIMIFFRDWISDWVTTEAEEVQDQSRQNTDNPF